MKAAAAKDAVGLVRRLARLRGLTPLDRAMELCSSGAAAPGSVAHIVLNSGDKFNLHNSLVSIPSCTKKCAEFVADSS